MAKKEATIHESAFIKQLIDAGVPEGEAKTRIAALISKVKENMAGESVTEQNNVISIMVSNKVRELKSDKFDVLVIAAFPREDANEISRLSAVKKYNENPSDAIVNGLVDIVPEGIANAKKAQDGRYVLALDSREFLDNAKTIPNKKKGQPLSVRMQNKYMVLAGTDIGMVYGDVRMDAGAEYTVYGKGNEKTKAIYANSALSPRLIRRLPTEEFYKTVFDAIKESDIAMDALDALTTEKKGYIIVAGAIQMIEPTGGSGQRIILNTGDEKGLPVNSPFGEEGVPYAQSMSKTPLGADVLVIGRVRNSDKYGRSVTCYGILNNGDTHVAKTLESLSDAW
jgi:hypothetical protein